MLAILFVFGSLGRCEELYHEFQCYLVLFFIHLLANVFGKLNILKNIF